MNLVVSPTSRSAAGADLLVTNQDCSFAWSVQVKTNRKPANFWLLGSQAKKIRSKSHIYVFVNIGDGKKPDEFLVVPSNYVADHVDETTAKTGSTWYQFNKSDYPPDGLGWDIFNKPAE